ncbi:MAG: hypothetical protein ACI9H9_002283 [Pseudoalteromonas tetraodonis]|jgi:hypothetical protein|nr:hypothetical protein PSM_B0268 [Pseudoalteromonas sp. SM9913]
MLSVLVLKKTKRYKNVALSLLIGCLFKLKRVIKKSQADLRCNLLASF